jgi:hypothetical protein
VNASTRASCNAASFRFRAVAGSADKTAAHECPQLAAGQSRRLPDDQLLHRGSVLIIEAGQFIGDDLGAPFVDQPGR